VIALLHLLPDLPPVPGVLHRVLVPPADLYALAGAVEDRNLRSRDHSAIAGAVESVGERFLTLESGADVFGG
jgi:hypothetical protein